MAAFGIVCVLVGSGGFGLAEQNDSDLSPGLLFCGRSSDKRMPADFDRPQTAVDRRGARWTALITFICLKRKDRRGRWDLPSGRWNMDGHQLYFDHSGRRTGIGIADRDDPDCSEAGKGGRAYSVSSISCRIRKYDIS